MKEDFCDGASATNQKAGFVIRPANQHGTSRLPYCQLVSIQK